MSALALQPGFFDLGPQQLADDAEGGIRYLPGVVPPSLARAWFEVLRESVAWQAMRRPMYDRVVDVPRLVCAYRAPHNDKLHTLVAGHYDHGVPKVRGPVGPRISLAFRVRPAGTTRD